VADEVEMIFIIILAIIKAFSHEILGGYGVGLDLEKANLTKSHSRLPILGHYCRREGFCCKTSFER